MSLPSPPLPPPGATVGSPFLGLCAQGPGMGWGACGQPSGGFCDLSNTPKWTVPLGPYFCFSQQASQGP